MRNIDKVFVNGVCLEEILEKHEKWINKEKGGERAKLNSVDLSYVDLSGVNLFDANLYNADLTNTDLTKANLSYANLNYVDLTQSNLNLTNLSYANLSCANLSFTNLIDVNLTNSDLKYADLKYANLIDSKLNYTTLHYANLIHANLINTDLSNANLNYANLMCSNLKRVNLDNVRYNECTSFFAPQCPEEGSFIGYKKSRGKIVKLLITEDAERSNATTRKCRCSKAKVLSITNVSNTKEYDKVASDYDKNFIYRVGEIVEVKDFDENRWVECSTGIHFFLTRDEAVRY